MLQGCGLVRGQVRSVHGNTRRNTLPRGWSLADDSHMRFQEPRPRPRAQAASR